MPWHIVDHHSECPDSKPYAVVKDSDGHVEGCHPTRAKAEDQLAALYANESGGTVTPIVGTQEPQEDAARSRTEVPVTDTLVDVALGSTDSSVVDKPWDGSAGRFTDEQYRNAAAACDPDAGTTTKQQCFLPHHEPGGATNRRGVHAAAQRASQLTKYSAAAVGRAKGHLRSHYAAMGEKPPDSIAASLQLTWEEYEALEAAGEYDEATYGGKPSRGTDADGRLKRNKQAKAQTPNSAAQLAADGEPPPVMSEPPNWRGPLVVEGKPTGDGREFAVDAVTWVDPPLPLRWQKEDSHGGMPTNVTVRVGTITKVWRDGSDIVGEGVVDLSGPEDDDAHKVYRTMESNGGMGVSIDADDITDADIEYVFPQAEEDGDGGGEDDLLLLLFAQPEKVIFHAARIRAATLCDIPAFVEAQVSLIPEDERAALAASAVADAVGLGFVRAIPEAEREAPTPPPAALAAAHETATSDAGWDGPATEARLPAELPVDVAARAYAWLDAAQVVEGRAPKLAARFLHHEVDEDGAPGAANLTACSSGLGVLQGGRGGTNLPDADRRGVYEHLAKHLRDAGQEPPPFGALDALVAHAWHDEWRPARSWFADPKLGQYTPIVVTDQGRVYGHACQWADCHLGFKDECVVPPRERDFPYFLTGEVVCDDGSRVAVGQVTAGLTHAPLSYGHVAARQHYENTDAVVADVTVGEDRVGIWVAGAVRPAAQAARVSALRGSGQVSPDWRWIGGGLRMVALLTVNVSGYQVPRARSFVAGGQLRSLVASGMVSAPSRGPTEEDLNKRAVQLLREQWAARVHG